MPCAKTPSTRRDLLYRPFQQPLADSHAADATSDRDRDVDVTVRRTGMFSYEGNEIRRAAALLEDLTRDLPTVLVADISVGINFQYRSITVALGVRVPFSRYAT